MTKMDVEVAFQRPCGGIKLIGVIDRIYPPSAYDSNSLLILSLESEILNEEKFSSLEEEFVDDVVPFALQKFMTKQSAAFIRDMAFSFFEKKGIYVRVIIDSRSAYLTSLPETKILI